jgi:phosphotransferase system HPr (HPr) family protein
LKGLPLAQRTTSIASSVGLHARPASILANAASSSGHDVTLTAKGRTVDADSLLSVLSLGIGHGDEVVINVEGSDDERVADEITALLASDLDKV